ncbi:MAG TPA: tetratricopeptide repeat protein, partial [Anaerolineales bacterium]|nr:tetratricopeptide repeat protein [Anaerolineales bacterium]
IIATSRTHGDTKALEVLIDAEIDLKGLSLEAIARLTEILLGGVPAVELVKLLMERSEGNPYFVIQIIRYLQEGNFIEMSKRGWIQVKRPRDFFLPSDISSLLVARLDQLTPEVKDVVQTASVLGREFTLPVLVEMAGRAESVRHIVLDAQQTEIWTSQDEDRYVFTHGLLRDAAYSMQMRARRMELHALAVNALESLYEKELHLHYVQLAHHAERAQLMEKAVHYLRRAARTASDSYQNNQAVDFYTRALAFVDPDDLAGHYDLLAERVELYSRMGQRDLQWKDLTALERWANVLGDKDRISKTLMLQASYYFATGDYLNSIDCAKGAESHFTAASVEHTELALYTQVVWCMALLRLGRLDEAMQRAWATLYRDRSVGNRREECRILTAMGLIALEQKEPAKARTYLVDAMEIAREIKDPGLEARALNNLALSEASVNGNYALARQYYEKSYKIAIEIGDRIAESLALGNLGFTAGMQGDFVAARAYHEQSLYLAREIGNRYHETYILINLSAVAGFQNEAQLALQYALQAFELSQKISERAGEAWSLLYMGHAYLLQNELEAARTAYHKSIAIRNELNQPSLSMEPTAGLVESYLQAGDLDSASEETEHILNFFESGATLDGTDEPLRVYYACYMFLEKRGDPRSKQVLQAGMKLLEERVSKFSDETTRTQYVENIPWRRALRDAAQVYLN